jgi:hypothetical protein
VANGENDDSEYFPGVRTLQEAVAALQADLAVSRDMNARLQKLLNEAREPSGHRHEEVAEWLRGRGYEVRRVCKYPDCDGGPDTGYCHRDCRPVP